MSAVEKRSVAIRGHQTSFSLERPFLDEIMRIAQERGVPLARLVGEIDEAKPRGTNLSSALRLHVLEWYRARAGATGPG